MPGLDFLVRPSDQLDSNDYSCMAAVCHLKDIDSFIANVTVPPPPSSGGTDILTKASEKFLNAGSSKRSLMSNDDISAFIIPPPPRAPPTSVESTPKRIPNRDIDLSLAINKEGSKEKISPKIASIQQRLANLTSPSAEDSVKKEVSFADDDPGVPPPPPPPRMTALRGKHPDPSGLKLNLKTTEVEPATKRSPGSPFGQKLRSTSSSDSLSSNASVNTVKSVSPVEEKKDDGPESIPPVLPPRISSMSPPAKPAKTPTQSPVKDVPPSPKPAVPSRNNKPSPTKITPPPPPAKTSPLHSNRQLPRPPQEEAPPRLPQKVIPSSERLNVGRKLPKAPASPKDKPRSNGHVVRVTNGHENDAKLEIYSNKHFDLIGTSVDDGEQHDNEVNYVVQTDVRPPKKLIIMGGNVGESNDDDDDDALRQASRILVFKKAEEVVAKVVKIIEESQELCGKNKGNKSLDDPSSKANRERYQRAKEHLTNESRQFVTASKLFVKSATESEGQLMECLNHCVQMVDRIGNITRDVAVLTPTPLQTQTLLAKVRDVADTYLQTVQAAGYAIGKDMNDPAMGVLMKRATSLASVLTTLMRSLRVFT